MPDQTRWKIKETNTVLLLYKIAHKNGRLEINQNMFSD
jgi:hypothetical protein